MKRGYIALIFLFLSISLVGADLQLGTQANNIANVDLEPSPSRCLVCNTNFTFNESAGDALYIRRDGTSTESNIIPFTYGMRIYDDQPLYLGNLPNGAGALFESPISEFGTLGLMLRLEPNSLNLNQSSWLKLTSNVSLRADAQPGDSGFIELLSETFGQNSTFYNITADRYFGNGSRLTDVCLSNGTNCKTQNSFYQNNQAVNTTSNVTFNQLIVTNLTSGYISIFSNASGDFFSSNGSSSSLSFVGSNFYNAYYFFAGVYTTNSFRASKDVEASIAVYGDQSVITPLVLTDNEDTSNLISNITLLSGAGTNAKITITGNSKHGQINITTGTLPTLGAVVFTANFTKPIDASHPLYIVFSEANVNAVSQLGKATFYMDNNLTHFRLVDGGASLACSTSCLINYWM